MSSEILQGIPDYVVKLQLDDGSFTCQEGNAEADIRFAYCAVAINALLETPPKFDCEKLKDFLLSCLSYEGGFSMVPGGESNAGITYCAVSALVLMNFELEVELIYTLKPWVLSRLTKQGATGRTNKVPDCCYAFYNYALLLAMQWEDFIDKNEVRDFIMRCETKKGGFSKFQSSNKDLSVNEPDIQHTFYALAALSLVGSPGLKKFNPKLGTTQTNRVL